MNRNIILAIAAVALLGIGAAGGVLVYNAVVGGDGEASEPISAPTLDINAPPTISSDEAFALATENAELAAEVEALRTEVAAMPEVTEVPAPAAEVTEAPTPAATEEAATGESADAGTDAGAETTRSLFRIVAAESEARFNIDEDLRGNRITVVGVTDQVAGDIIVDYVNPAGSQVGTIRVNMRTLATDNMFRNQALRAQILQSSQDEFEFADFVPTALEGMPDGPVAAGDTLTFQITGDLTIRNVTRTVTFEATVTVDSDSRITGLATAEVLYADFNLTIPEVPGVANISDEVIIEIDFVAELVESA